MKDLGLGRALRNYYLIWWPISVAVLLPLTILFTSMLVPAQGMTDTFHSALLITAMAVAVVSWIYLVKRVYTVVTPYDPDVLTLLDRPQRRSVRRQIFGRMPLHPEQSRVARAVAVQLRKKLAEQLIFSGFTMLIVIGSLRPTEPFWVWMFAALIVVLLAVISWELRRFVLTGRFLKRTTPGKEG
ncbi:hypothetical protein [Arthrobacter tecti]